MIDRGEESLDVAFQNVGIFPAGPARGTKSSMGPETRAIGEAAGEEPSLKQRRDDRAQGMVNNPIPERSGGYQARFWIPDAKAHVFARQVGLFRQFLLKLPQEGIAMEIKPGNGASAPLSLSRLEKRIEKVLRIDDLLERAQAPLLIHPPTILPISRKHFDTNSNCAKERYLRSRASRSRILSFSTIMLMLCSIAARFALWAYMASTTDERSS
jgi:hypothetical protein